MADCDYRKEFDSDLDVFTCSVEGRCSGDRTFGVPRAGSLFRADLDPRPVGQSERAVLLCKPEPAWLRRG